MYSTHLFVNQDCSVNIVRRLQVGQPLNRNSFPDRGKKFFSSQNRPVALESTQPPIRLEPVAFCFGEKRLEREVDHSPSCSTEV